MKDITKVSVIVFPVDMSPVIVAFVHLLKETIWPQAKNSFPDYRLSLYAVLIN